MITKPAGPIEAIELFGFVDGRGRGTLYPATASGATPSIRLTYYRLPTAMPGDSPETEFPDIDPKYQDLTIYGSVVELSRNTGFEFDRYAGIEREMLLDLASTAKGM